MKEADDHRSPNYLSTAKGPKAPQTPSLRVGIMYTRRGRMAFFATLK